MFENQLEECLSTDNFTKNIFIGVHARDEIPTPKYPSCFILNTEPRSESGEHWLAFYFTKNGYCDFFDSYGMHPAFYGLDTYLDNNSEGWEWNKKRIQGNSSFCGFYCLLYLLFRSRNKQNNFFNNLSTICKKNDVLIADLIKEFE